MESGFFGNISDAPQQLLGTGPPDFHATEQVSLRSRHLENAFRLELRARPEDLRIRPEAYLGAATVGDAAELFQLAFGFTALEYHAVERLLARDLDFHALGERVGNRDAHAVQPTRRIVDFRIEFPARVQRAHDHFEGRLLREFRMGIDGDAAPVVSHGYEAIGVQTDIDERGVARKRL